MPQPAGPVLEELSNPAGQGGAGAPEGQGGPEEMLKQLVMGLVQLGDPNIIMQAAKMAIGMLQQSQGGGPGGPGGGGPGGPPQGPPMPGGPQ